MAGNYSGSPLLFFARLAAFLRALPATQRLRDDRDLPQLTIPRCARTLEGAFENP